MAMGVISFAKWPQGAHTGNHMSATGRALLYHTAPVYACMVWKRAYVSLDLRSCAELCHALACAWG